MSAETDLLKEIRDNWKDADAERDDIRKEAKTDRLVTAGKVWQALDPDAVKERKDAKRPFLSNDEINQFLNQTVNDIRANPRGLKYAPTGNGANDAGAEFYENHTREIEYRSHARVAYARAFEDAAIGGYGWTRIRTKRQHVRTFNQDLYIEPVMNPDQVLPDPNSVWPDSRDIKFLFFAEPWARSEFKRRFPKAEAVNFAPEQARIATGWLDRDRIRVAEYWKLESITRKLVAWRPVGDPGPERVNLLDELPDGKLPDSVENLRSEDVEDTRVRCWLTNGLEILQEQEWLGKYIPFVSCYGKILYIEDGGGPRRVLISMVRLARDPQMLYAYMTTCGAEAVGGVPRASFIGYEGQFAKPQQWTKANRAPVAYLEAKVTVPGSPTQSPLPLPMKQAWDPPLQNIEIAKEAARRAIQAAMGITPLPTPMQRQNQKSGKALERMESAGQRGSFHLVDAYELMIERVGIILEDLMDKVIDTVRDVPVRKAGADTGTIVRVNDPNAQDPIFTKGDYRVTISTGPATDSQREEARGFVDAMVGNVAAIAQIAGPMAAMKLMAKSVKLKQLGPIGDEIIDLLDPQQIGKDGKPVPPEVARLLAENQQLKGLLQKAAQEKQAKVIEQQGKFQTAKYQTDVKSRDAAADREVKLAVAELSARVDRMALLLEESRLVGVRADEQRGARIDREHDAHERARDRIHERVMTATEHLQAQALQEQAAQHASEAAAQQAALQPVPDESTS